MSKKWYEYLLTVRPTTNTGVMDPPDAEPEEDDEPESPFVAVPAPPPGKSAVVAAAVTEAFSRSHSITPPPLPSRASIMTPSQEPVLSLSTNMESAISLAKTPPPPSSSAADLKLDSVSAIYDQSNLMEMTHGYSALKVVSMLKSEHLRNMPMEAKRSSILLALEASGTKLQDVVDDALRRIRLLQQQERETARALEALERRKIEENQNISEELARIVQEYNQQVQSNTEQVARMKAQFLSWRMEVKEEEQRISEALSYFTGQQLQLKESAEGSKGEKP